MSNHNSLSGLLVLKFLFISVILSGCAEVAPPPGGEIDRQSPYIISSLPKNKETNVTAAKSVTIFFSERIVRPEKGASIFISPGQKKEPEIKWKSDKIIITLAENFKENTTYIISLSSNIKDLRGNLLDSSLSIAFSTGNEIATGRVSGFVTAENKPQPGMLAALYERKDYDSVINLSSQEPDYITYSNKSGFFQFDYLPESDFYLLAFRDENRNGIFDSQKESFATPDRMINLSDSLSFDSLFLPLNKQFFHEIKITSVHFDQNKILIVRLNREISIDKLKENNGTIKIVSPQDELTTIPISKIQESDLAFSSVLSCHLDSISEGEYSVAVSGISDLADLSFKNYYFKNREDKSGPEIRMVEPDSLPQLSKKLDISILFNEPIDRDKLTSETFSLWHDTTNVPGLKYEFVNDFKVKLSADRITPGISYRLKITEFEISDISGNLMGDSLISYKMSLVHPDSLGIMSGEVIISIEKKQNDRVKLTAENYKTHQFYPVILIENKFSSTLPAGKYRLFGFIDSNKNGKRDKGQVDPYRLSETFASYPDTLDVRARFENAEIFIQFK